ncbi:hypothetical protein P7C70_g8294, partial [Phenoliferia sp. Uapishka_3]
MTIFAFPSQLIFFFSLSREKNRGLTDLGKEAVEEWVQSLHKCCAICGRVFEATPASEATPGAQAEEEEEAGPPSPAKKHGTRDRNKRRPSGSPPKPPGSRGGRGRGAGHKK